MKGNQAPSRVVRWVLSSWLVLVNAACVNKASQYTDATLPNNMANPVAFPLALSADGRYLVDRQGQPFLIHGDAAWSLMVQLTREDAVKYLEDRRRRGFNLLMVSVVEHKFSDNPPKNKYGDAPFERAGDFSAPRAAYFDHVEWVLRKAEQLGFAVLLCPAYLGYGGGEEGWYQDEVRSGPDTMRAYGRYLGARYKDFPNIIWLQGGDFRPPDEHLELVNAVAEGLLEAGAKQLQTAHWAPEMSAVDVAVRGWLALNNTYTYEPTYKKCQQDHARGQPYFLIESKYENEREVTAQQLRAQSYFALLSGAIGQIFGNLPMWRFDRGWQSALTSPGSVSMTHLRALFGPRRWMDLTPDLSHQILVEGTGAAGSPDRALLASTADGRLAIAYMPSRRALGIDVKRLGSPLKARWYDPSNGKFAAATPVSGERGARYEPPGNNAVGDSDWVLLLESAQ